MKTLLAASVASVLIAAAAAPLEASAHDVSLQFDAPNIGVRIGVPFGEPFFAPPPVFVSPPPVYGSPVVYVHDAVPGYFWRGEYQRYDERDYPRDYRRDYRHDYGRDYRREDSHGHYRHESAWHEHEWRDHDGAGDRDRGRGGRRERD